MLIYAKYLKTARPISIIFSPKMRIWCLGNYKKEPEGKNILDGFTEDAKERNVGWVQVDPSLMHLSVNRVKVLFYPDTRSTANFLNSQMEFGNCCRRFLSKLRFINFVESRSGKIHWPGSVDISFNHSGAFLCPVSCLQILCFPLRLGSFFSLKNKVNNWNITIIVKIYNHVCLMKMLA